MDELDVLTSYRPAHQPPTSGERAAVKEQLMSFIQEDQAAAAPPPNTISITEGRSRRPAPRRRRYAAMAGVAAAVALVAVAVGASGRGPAPLQAGPSAAQQLRTIAATVEQADPYPTGPYSVASRTRTSVEYDEPSTIPNSSSSVEQVEYAVGGGDYVSRQTECVPATFCGGFMSARGGDPEIPFDGTAAQVRAGVERRVTEFLAMDTHGAPQPTRGFATLTTVQGALQDPAMQAAGRAELLRILAETPDITAEADVANSFGLVGTRFTVTANGSTIELLIDPADGYILRFRWGGVAVANTPVTADTAGDGSATTWAVGGWGSESVGRSDLSIDFARPVAVDPLPTDVAALAAAVRAHASSIEAIFPTGGCSSESGSNKAGWRYGFDIPTDLTFTHCW